MLHPHGFVDSGARPRIRVSPLPGGERRPVPAPGSQGRRSAAEICAMGVTGRTREAAAGFFPSGNCSEHERCSKASVGVCAEGEHLRESRDDGAKLGGRPWQRCGYVTCFLVGTEMELIALPLRGLAPGHSWFHRALRNFTLQVGNTLKKIIGFCSTARSMWGFLPSVHLLSRVRAGGLCRCHGGAGDTRGPSAGRRSDLGLCCRGQSRVNKWMCPRRSTNALKPGGKKHKTPGTKLWS